MIIRKVIKLFGEVTDAVELDPNPKTSFSMQSKCVYLFSKNKKQQVFEYLEIKDKVLF